MTDVLIVVSSKRAGPFFRGMAAALERAGCSWSVFLTHNGVQLVAEPWFTDTVKSSHEAVMCAESWSSNESLQSLPDDSPIVVGSQTNHAGMVADASRVVSF